MATLVVRQLDDDIVRRLKERAAAHGRSAEAEHRVILDEALRPRPRTGAELVAALRGKGPWLDDGWDERMRELDQPVEAPDLPR
jgi:antitoxin FitA